MKKRAKPKAAWLIVDAETGRPHQLGEKDWSYSEAFPLLRYLPASGSAEAKLKVAVRALRKIQTGHGARPHQEVCVERWATAKNALARIERMGRKP